MKRLDVGSSIFWIGICVYICLRSVRLGLGTVRNPGPGFLFFWSGVILGILAVVVLISALSKKGGQDGVEGEKPFDNVHWWKVIGVILSLACYAIIIEKLGFLLSTVLLMVFLLRSIEVKKWYVVILVAVTTAFVSYALFELWLRSRLPKGIFGL